jgi:hypothetical protein
MRARERSFSKYLVVMLALLWSAALVSGPIWAAAAPAVSSSVSKAQAAECYGRLPLFFTENRGQVDSKVKFYTRGQGHSVFFTPEGMILSLSRASGEAKGKGKEASKVLQLRPQGISPAVEIMATEPLEGKVNFFQGSDPAKWVTDVPTYKSVLYREAYPGIDLKFYGAGRQVEYDLVIKPGADPKQVKFLYQGIEALKLTKAGDLTVTLPGGGKLVQKRPVIYQEINGQRVSREGKFRLLPGKRGYGFELASYDTRFPLIIDPVILVYSTFLGGDTFESGNGIAVNASGSAYVVGTTQSENFPVLNAFQPGFGGGNDAFVTKFNPAGNTLAYSTFLGGDDNDYGFGIAVDGSGNAYVTGETFSTGFPVTGTAYQSSLTGFGNAFVTKLSATGGLAYSTYLGGTGSEVGKSIAVDGSGNAYVAGDTNSGDFPVVGGFQGLLNGTNNAFVSKIAPTTAGPAGLLYSTYLGGSVSDTPWGIAVDTTGAAYVAGETSSSDFPKTNASVLQGITDAFVTKINPGVSGAASLVYSFFWGGTGSDSATGAIAVDTAGNSYVAGNTDSTDFPTVTPFQATLNGFTNAFVTKFNATGTAVYSTYLGGDGSDIAWFIALDNAGRACVTGQTSSTNFPTLGALQNTLTGSPNAFVTKFNASGTTLFYSTYLGGTISDYGFGIAANFLKVYVTGFTQSTDFPTLNPFQAAAPPLTSTGTAFVTAMRTKDLTPAYLLLLLD